MRPTGLTNLLVAGGIGLLGALPLWQPGFLNKRIIGETPYLLMRVQQLASQLQSGTFPVRWMPDAAYGLGYPFYNFYAAFPFYFAAILRVFGYDTVLCIKLIQTLSFVFGAVGVYVWLRPHLQHRSTTLAAAILFTWAPMHLVNIYVRGDSLSEFWAMSMYPWILWAIDQVIARPRPPQVALLALTYGALLLSHNISALLFSPLVALYALWMLLPKWRNRRVWLALLGGGVLGAALAAWFFAPALLEQPYLRMENMLAGFFDYRNSFLDSTPFQQTWTLQYEAYPYRVGMLQAISLSVGGVALAAGVILRRRGARLALFVLTGLLISLGMTFSLSNPVYEVVPLLKYVQFPWRWLSIVALFGAAAGAYLVEWWPWRTVRMSVLIAIFILTLSAVLPTLDLHFFPLSEGEITPQRLAEAEFYSGDIGTTVRADYLPLTVYPRPLSGPAIVGKQALKVLDGEAEGSRDEEGRWWVNVTSPQALIAVPTLYFPGWVARLEDGTRLPTSAVEGIGWVQAVVPGGAHLITLRFEETPVRWFFDAISALALLVWLALVARPLTSLRPTRTAYVRSIAVAVLLIFVMPNLTRAAPVSGPTASQFETASYRHHFPNGIQFKGGSRLVDYRYPTEIRPGQSLEVELTWDHPVPAYASLIPALVNFWKYDAALSTGSGTDRIALNVPPDAAPGLYFLHLEAASDSYDLAPVRVLNIDLPVNQGLEYNFGNVLGLREIRTEGIDRGRLNVMMHWVVKQPIARNYGLSVKLLDATGARLASHEAPLGVYGTYPPAYWDKSFTDWFSLPGLEGLPPGDGYRMIVTVFDNDRPVGSADIRNIAVKFSPESTSAAPSVTLAGDRTEQGMRLLLKAVWPGDLRGRVRWRLRSDQMTWEQTTALAPGARLDWWRPDQQYRTLIPLRLPVDLAPGHYVASWDLVDEAGQVIRTGEQMGVVEVIATTRRFNPPPMTITADAHFGDVIRLAGYDLKQTPGQLSLRLGWQALAEMDTDYTFFVHLQHADAPPAAQADLSRATSTWIPGEYLTDETSINLGALPPGRYDVWLGWYNPNGGGRFSVPGSSDQRYHLAQVKVE